MLTNRTYKTYVRDYNPVYVSRSSSIWERNPVTDLGSSSSGDEVSSSSSSSSSSSLNNASDSSLSSSSSLGVENGLRGYWTFNEGTGSSTADITGNGLTGVITGATWSTDVPFVSNPYSLSFVNNGDVVKVQDNALLNNSSFSISIWVKLSAINTTRFLIGKDTGLNGYGIYFQSNNVIACFVANGSQFFDTKTGIGEGQLTDMTSWHHIVFTFTSGSQKIYLDGVESGLSQGGAEVLTPTYNNRELWIGGSEQSPSSGFFTGKIDEVRIYNRVLTQPEVSLLYSGT